MGDLDPRMLIPDHETELDYLNCESISQTVVELLEGNRNRPLTLGIHGDWGAGKTSILKMIEAQLSSDKEIAVLWFNGWTFEGFNDAKTVMIENTVTELLRQRPMIGKLKEKANKLLKRVNWLNISKQGTGLVFNLLTGLPSAAQVETGVGVIQRLGQNSDNVEGSETQGKLENVTGFFLKPVEKKDNLPDTIHRFREELTDLIEEAQVKQIVVLIDDLDRCLPTTTIHTLEAIKLFLFVPKMAFIIGADEAMIEYAVKQHFPDLPVSSGPLPYARNYLEKLIQVPFRIPTLGAQETRIFVTLLLVQSIIGDPHEHEGFDNLLKKGKGILRQPWLGVGLSQTDVQNVDKSAREGLNMAFVMAQQIAPILAEGTEGNPRQIKRFLNALLVRQIIAKARGFGEKIKQPVLAKLMLAERFQPDFYEQVSIQAMSSSDGKVSILADLESTGKQDLSEGKAKSVVKAADRKGTREKKTESQNTKRKWHERDWLIRWLQLEPALACEDLRPYVFVASDRRFPVSTAEQSSQMTLISKLCGSMLEIRAVETSVKMLSTMDAKVVFEGVRDRVLGIDSFITEPPGMGGLAIIAKHHPTLQCELIAMLETPNPKDLGLWVVKGWNEAITDNIALKRLKNLMHVWIEQSDNKALKMAAESAISTLSIRGD